MAPQSLLVRTLHSIDWSHAGKESSFAVTFCSISVKGSSCEKAIRDITLPPSQEVSMSSKEYQTEVRSRTLKYKLASRDEHEETLLCVLVFSCPREFMRDESGTGASRINSLRDGFTLPLSCTGFPTHQHVCEIQEHVQSHLEARIGTLLPFVLLHNRIRLPGSR